MYPSDVPEITYEIDFDHPLLDTQRYHHRCGEDAFVREIARARTFGFLAEVEYLRSQGFAKGGSLDNAVVIADYRVLNPEGLRYPDECVRHKILDLIGDLSLVGAPLLGHVVARRAGHALHAALAREILRRPERWVAVTRPAELLRPAAPAGGADTAHVPA